MTAQCCIERRWWADLPPFWLSCPLSTWKGAASAPWKSNHLHWMEYTALSFTKLPPWHWSGGGWRSSFPNPRCSTDCLHCHMGYGQIHLHGKHINWWIINLEWKVLTRLIILGTLHHYHGCWCPGSAITWTNVGIHCTIRNKLQRNLNQNNFLF